MSPLPSNDRTRETLPRKRVILKVWQKDGHVLDTVGHVEWLERQGWSVVCAEPLLQEPADGFAYVSYLLEWKKDTQPTDPIPEPVKPPEEIVPPLKPNGSALVTCSAAEKVLLLAHVTRGGIAIHDLDNDRVIMDLSTVPERGPLTARASFDRYVDNDFPPHRQFLFLCRHDAGPAPGSSPDIPDGSPATITLDVCFVQKQGDRSKLVRLAQQILRPGDFCSYHVFFNFRPI